MTGHVDVGEVVPAQGQEVYRRYMCLSLKWSMC